MRTSRRPSARTPSWPPSCSPTTRSAPSSLFAELAAAAHEAGVAFHTDAVQAFGHEPIDVNELGIDMLSRVRPTRSTAPRASGFCTCARGVKLAEPSRRRAAGARAPRLPRRTCPASSASRAPPNWPRTELRARARPPDWPCATMPSARILEEIPSRQAQRQLGEPPGQQRELLLRVHRGRGHAAAAGRPGHLRVLRQRLHLRLARPEPRAAGHRPSPRDRPRLAAHDARAATPHGKTSTSPSDSLKATLQNLRAMSPLYEDFQHGQGGIGHRALQGRRLPLRQN